MAARWPGLAVCRHPVQTVPFARSSDGRVRRLALKALAPGEDCSCSIEPSVGGKHVR